MNRFSKSALLLGAALAVLSACSGTKGPGEIGSKDDIVVRNNGLPAANAPAPDADFSSTVEQGEAIPAPEVAAAEPLPEASLAVDAAAQQVAEAKAPMPSTAAAPVNDMTTSSTAPATESKPIDQIAPQTPVQDAASVAPPVVASATATTTAAPAAPVPAPAATPSSVYPSADYPAAAEPVPAPVAAATSAPATTPAPTPAPSPNAYVPVPAGTSYPLDPNAPYSPKAMASANAPAPAPATSAPVSAAGLNLSDPAVIRSAQTALKAKAGYAGEASGTIDAAFLNALTVYQGMNKLPVGGLNEPTLRHLGVIE